MTQKPPHLSETTLLKHLNATLSPTVIDEIAQQFAVVGREGGKVQPYELTLALLQASVLGPSRTIAEVRRQWEAITGSTISRSAFDAHFSKLSVHDMIWKLVERSMRCANRALRRHWPKHLQSLRDILIDDGTRMALPKAAREEFPATTEDDAGVKLMTRISLLDGLITRIEQGSARTHDHALRPSTAYARGTLILRDLGFYDHEEFRSIDAADAFYLSRWKQGTVATIDGHVSGMLLPENCLQGDRVDREAVSVLGDVSDLDARLQVGGQPTLSVRLVRVRCTEKNRKTGESTEVDRWYVTNLPRETWSPTDLSRLYSLRWLIERTFRRAKHHARLDQLWSTRPTAIGVLLGAALLLGVLSERIAYYLVGQFGVREISVDRCSLIFCSVLPMLLTYITELHGRSRPSLAQIAKVIAHESRHRNATQLPLIDRIFSSLGSTA